jgi:hypothetical protein
VKGNHSLRDRAAIGAVVGPWLGRLVAHA